MKEKICENCHYIDCLDTDNIGLCNKVGILTDRDSTCDSFAPNLNGWREITPEIENEIRNIKEDMVVIGWKYNGAMRACTLSYCPFPLDVILKQGGFYYYVLPELKIE